MTRRHELVYALNAGSVDPEAVARIDLEKMRLAGEHPVLNILPRVLGPGTLRPGTESIVRIPGDVQTKQVAFVREVGDNYMLLFSAGEMRVTRDGVIQQVPDVATRIVPGAWTNASSSPSTATGGATLSLTASKTALAKIRQAVTVATDDQVKVNILRIVVERGPVVLRLGTTAGGDELLADAELDEGTHKIGVTPGAATLHIEIQSSQAVERRVSSIEFEAAFGTGDFVLPTPWTTFDKVKKVRRQDSIDVVFCGDGSVQQRRIEHRGALSWGICLFKSNSGPFVSGSDRITMTPTARTGNTTITASENVFKPGHVGTLLELTQTSKTVSETLTAADQVTDYVTIIGVDSGRTFYTTGEGSLVGTLVLERSFDAGEPVSWSAYSTTIDAESTFPRASTSDTLNNLTVHYRFRLSAYTSGSITATIEYESGVQTGRARITAVNSPTNADIEIYISFGNTNAARTWRIGDWSSVRGWPSVPLLHDGRMHWFREDEHFASKPDDYPNLDDTVEGEAAPFTRSVGVGGKAGVLWALSQNRLVVGTSFTESTIQASELDEPLTALAYTVRTPSSRGCADVEPAEHDNGFFFVQRSSRRLYEMSIPEGSTKMRSQDISRLNPAAFRPGIVRIAVQQQPDTRCHASLETGDLAILTYERDDKVIAITNAVLVGGLVEDVEVMTSSDQDDVYLIVNRGGQRYQERFAKEAAQTSPATCALLDAHKVLTGSVSAITGGTHLAGQTVQVWADGARHADVTLDGAGYAVLDGTYARVVYGLKYLASFKSVKLAYAAQLGTAAGQTKIVHGAGIILSNACLDGVRFGPDADHLDPLPDYVRGALRTPSQFFTHYDADITPINAEWDADARFYLQIDSAEGPCTIQAIVLDVETRDGVQAQAGNG